MGVLLLCLIAHVLGGAPSVPEDLEVTSVTATEISLKWTTLPADPAILGFEVWYRASGSADEVIFVISETSSYALSDLTAGSTYYVRVRARNILGANGNFSAEVEATTGSTPPSKPLNVVATPVDNRGSTRGFINVSWSPPVVSGGPSVVVVSYEITYTQYNGDSPPFIPVTVTTDSNDTSTCLSYGVLPGTGYIVSVRAKSSVPLLGAPSDVAVVETAPGAPSHVTALTTAAMNSSAIEISWTKPHFTGGIQVTLSFYNVTWIFGDQASSSILPHTEGDATMTTTISPLRPGATYNITVRPFNSEGFHGEMAQASSRTALLPPSAPSAITIMSTTPTAISCAWPESAFSGGEEAHVAHYKVSAVDPDGNAVAFATMPADVLYYTIDSLLPGTPYLVSVQSENSEGLVGEAISMNIATDLVAPTAPRGVRAAVASSSSITVSWELPASLGGHASLIDVSYSALCQRVARDGRSLSLPVSIETVNGGGVRASLGDLEAGAVYGVSVQASNGALVGPYSAQVLVETYPVLDFTFAAEQIKTHGPGTTATIGRHATDMDVALVLELASSDALLAVPGTVTIPRGASSSAPFFVVPSPDLPASFPGGEARTVVLTAVGQADSGLLATTEVSVVSNPPRFDVVTSTVEVWENDTDAVFSARVRLSQRPSRPVTFPVSADPEGSCAAHPDALVFSPESWQEYQAVTWSVANDDAANGRRWVSVLLGPGDAPAPSFFSGEDSEFRVPFALMDDDVAGIVARAFVEGGALYLKISLTSRPSHDVLVPVGGTDVTAATVRVLRDAWAHGVSVPLSPAAADLTYNVTVGPSTSEDTMYRGLYAPPVFQVPQPEGIPAHSSEDALAAFTVWGVYVLVVGVTFCVLFTVVCCSWLRRRQQLRLHTSGRVSPSDFNSTGKQSVNNSWEDVVTAAELQLASTGVDRHNVLEFLEENRDFAASPAVMEAIEVLRENALAHDAFDESATEETSEHSDSTRGDEGRCNANHSLVGSVLVRDSPGKRVRSALKNLSNLPSHIRTPAKTPGSFRKKHKGIRYSRSPTGVLPGEHVYGEDENAMFYNSPLVEPPTRCVTPVSNGQAHVPWKNLSPISRGRSNSPMVEVALEVAASSDGSDPSEGSDAFLEPRHLPQVAVALPSIPAEQRSSRTRVDSPAPPRHVPPSGRHVPASPHPAKALGGIEEQPPPSTSPDFHPPPQPPRIINLPANATSPRLSGPP